MIGMPQTAVGAALLLALWPRVSQGAAVAGVLDELLRAITPGA